MKLHKEYAYRDSIINYLSDIPFPPIIVNNNNNSHSNKYSDNTTCYEDVSGSIKEQTHNVKKCLDISCTFKLLTQDPSVLFLDIYLRK